MYLNGKGTAKMVLPARPVDVHSVEVDGAVLLPGVGFRQDRDAGIIERTAGWFPEGLGTVKVTYDHGWEVIPGDIEDAVLEHATTIARVMAHLQQNSAGSTQESYGAAAMVGVTQKWAAAVARYSLNGNQG